MEWRGEQLLEGQSFLLLRIVKDVQSVTQTCEYNKSKVLTDSNDQPAERKLPKEVPNSPRQPEHPSKQ